MTDMIERACRAACKYQGYDPDPRQIDEGLYWQGWHKFEEMMRPILTAAFKVTDEDAKAFFGEPDANGGWFIFGTTANFRDGMQALSDAALKEGS